MKAEFPAGQSIQTFLFLTELYPSHEHFHMYTHCVENPGKKFLLLALKWDRVWG